MKFLSFNTNATAAEHLGVQLVDGRVFNVSEAAKEKSLNVPTSMISLIRAGDEGVQAVRSLMNSRISDEYLYQHEELVYLPPIKTGKNVFCVGRNYKEHIIEGNRANGRPEHQFPEAIEFFTKPPTALVGHRANVLRQEAITKSLDYEVELAIVIGMGGKDIKEEDALAHVFGYTVVNDITARDLQKRHGQWFKGKGLDTTCPMGPVITHYSAISYPNNLAVMLEVNGEVRQRHNTNDMIFSVQRIIAELSIGMTLEPGDVISTGTPQGVGFAMTPPRCLNAGDVVRAYVEGIGAIENTVVSS
jgi:2-keto-4-pentenoate hydratase/2-oxohepta-3-ene-1,7-dioic acid hydratase in catechol pathway